MSGFEVSKATFEAAAASRNTALERSHNDAGIRQGIDRGPRDGSWSREVARENAAALEKGLEKGGDRGASDLRLNVAAENAAVLQESLDLVDQSKLLRIDGKRPQNWALAGKSYTPKTAEARELAPNGVRFKENGCPDFTPWEKARVEIEPSNRLDDWLGDFRRANEAAGLERTPRGYTWHHMEDGKTMQLVPQSLHNAVSHSGGRSVINARIRGLNVAGV